MEINKIGYVGLGRMGYAMVSNLLGHGIGVVAYDLDRSKTDNLSSERKADVDSGKLCAAYSLEELAANLEKPKLIWLMINAGKPIDDTIAALLPYLSAEDVLIDGGNSFFRDSQRRGAELARKNISFMDVGTSGGVDGARSGACLMIGGDQSVYQRLEELFRKIAAPQGYLHAGPSGFGHLVKGVHNLVEYGYLQALAEGLVSLKEVSNSYGHEISLNEVCRVWSRRSLVESRLTRDAEAALRKNPTLDGISGSVCGQVQSEMEELVKISLELGVNVPAAEAAINARRESQKNPNLTGKIINIIRNYFGQHEVTLKLEEK
ncbi:MAG: NADP-dependent phosphogluconate dehydrogenase [Nanoarchaeota archaeon]